MINQEIKKAINSLADLGITMDEKSIGCSSFGKNVPTSNQIRIDFVSFCCSIICADNVITPQELEFLSDYFDYFTTSKELLSHIGSNKTDISKTPLSFQVFVSADKILKENGSNVSCTQLYYNILYTIGTELISIDGETSVKELDFFTKYLQALRVYAKNNGIDISYELEPKKITDIETKHVDQDEESLDSLLRELHALIGLATVKNDIQSLINLVKVRRIKEERGLKLPAISLHMVFTGNPGTGKTTIARLLSSIYCKMGLLSKGQLIEVDRSGLVGGYVGQTAIKVKNIIDTALGGILFIDEAYSLVGKGANDYGQEAIDTLLKAMEDYRNDFIVIVAGYPTPMNDFINSNPGLRSRFNKYIHFDDYTADELLKILIKLCSDNEMQLTEDAMKIASEAIDQYCLEKSPSFANGRDVRNYFEKILVNQANRIALISDISDDDLRMLIAEDVEKATIP